MNRACAPYIEFRQGDSWLRRFLFRQDGIPVQMFVDYAEFTVRDGYSGEVVAYSSTKDGTIEVDGESGQVDVLVSKTITKDIPAGNYLGELQITFTDGVQQSSPILNIMVTPDIALDRSMERTMSKVSPKLSVVKKTRYGSM